MQCIDFYWRMWYYKTTIIRKGEKMESEIEGLTPQEVDELMEMLQWEADES